MALVDFQIEFPPQGVSECRRGSAESALVLLLQEKPRGRREGKFEIPGREYFETAEEDDDDGGRN